MRIERMAFRHRLAFTVGRPPSGEGSGGSNRFLMRLHCDSMRNDCGAVLDSVVYGRCCFVRMDRVISI